MTASAICPARKPVAHRRRRPRFVEPPPQSLYRPLVDVPGNRRLPSLRRAELVDGVDDVLRVDVRLRRARIDLLLVRAVEPEGVQHDFELQHVAANRLLEHAEPERLTRGVVNAA